MRLGWKGPDFKDPRDFRYSAHPRRYRGHLAREVDLPETPVEEQFRSDCLFKALTSLMENVDYELYFSALWLYYQYRVRYGHVSVDDGGYIRLAIKLAAEIGCPREGLWPYNEGERWNVKPPDLMGDAMKHKVKEYWSLDMPKPYDTLDNILNRLASPEGNGSIFGMPLYESFLNVKADGLVPYPNLKAERCIGGHAMKVMGYKRGGEFLKVKNSWSLEWGCEGYAWFPYEMVHDFWSDIWTIDRMTE